MVAQLLYEQDTMTSDVPELCRWCLQLQSLKIHENSFFYFLDLDFGTAVSPKR
jgi:hypothetical protein